MMRITRLRMGRRGRREGTWARREGPKERAKSFASFFPTHTHTKKSTEANFEIGGDRTEGGDGDGGEVMMDGRKGQGK